MADLKVKMDWATPAFESSNAKAEKRRVLIAN